MAGWTLVQKTATQALAGTCTLPAGSTAGNLILVSATQGSGTALTAPAGFVTVGHANTSSGSESYLFAYYNNPGGLSSFVVGGGSGVAIQCEAAEFTCPNVALLTGASDVGTGTAGAVASITVSTTGTAQAGDLVVYGSCEHLLSASVIAWTDPSTDFTAQLAGSLVVTSTTNHGYGGYGLSATAGGVISITMTSSVASTSAQGWAGYVATFTPPLAPVIKAPPIPPPQPRPLQSQIITPPPPTGSANIGLNDAGTGTDALAVTVGAQVPPLIQAEPIPPPKPRPLASSVIPLFTGITVPPLNDAGTGTDALAVQLGANVPPVIQAEPVPPPKPIPPASQIVPVPPGAPVAVGLADAGTGTDTLAVAVNASLTDTGTGADALTVAIGAQVPAVIAAEPIPPPQPKPLASQVIQGQPPPPGLISLTDTGSGSDALAVAAGVGLADAGGGADTLAVAAGVALTDAGTGADALGVQVNINLADGGTGADTVTAAVPAPFTPGQITASSSPASATTGTAAPAGPLVANTGSNAVGGSSGPSGGMSGSSQSGGQISAQDEP